MSSLSFLKKKKNGKGGNDDIHSSNREMNHEPKEPDESNWLISYADMMTLLSSFFIMMFSMSTLNAPKFEKAREEVSKHFGGDFESPNNQLAKFVTQILQEEGIEDEAVVVNSPSGVSIIFQSSVFFDSLSSYVKKPARKIMKKLIHGVAKFQIKEEKEYKIVIEGHTDGQPIISGVYPSNWELSSARSAQVVRMFIEHDFKSKNLMPIGFGATRPQIEDRSPAGEWIPKNLAKNRRVVIRILNPDTNFIPWETESLENGLTKKKPSELIGKVASENSAH